MAAPLGVRPQRRPLITTDDHDGRKGVPFPNAFTMVEEHESDTAVRAPSLRLDDAAVRIAIMGHSAQATDALAYVARSKSFYVLTPVDFAHTLTVEVEHTELGSTSPDHDAGRAFDLYVRPLINHGRRLVYLE